MFKGNLTNLAALNYSAPECDIVLKTHGMPGRICRVELNEEGEVIILVRLIRNQIQITCSDVQKLHKHFTAKYNVDIQKIAECKLNIL